MHRRSIPDFRELYPERTARTYCPDATLELYPERTARRERKTNEKFLGRVPRSTKKCFGLLSPQEVHYSREDLKQSVFFT